MATTLIDVAMLQLARDQSLEMDLNQPGVVNRRLPTGGTNPDGSGNGMGGTVSNGMGGIKDAFAVVHDDYFFRVQAVPMVPRTRQVEQTETVTRFIILAPFDADILPGDIIDTGGESYLVGDSDRGKADIVVQHVQCHKIS